MFFFLFLFFKDYRDKLYKEVVARRKEAILTLTIRFFHSHTLRGKLHVKVCPVRQGDSTREFPVLFALTGLQRQAVQGSGRSQEREPLL